MQNTGVSKEEQREYKTERTEEQKGAAAATEGAEGDDAGAGDEVEESELRNFREK